MADDSDQSPIGFTSSQQKSSIKRANGLQGSSGKMHKNNSISSSSNINSSARYIQDSDFNSSRQILNNQGDVPIGKTKIKKTYSQAALHPNPNLSNS